MNFEYHADGNLHQTFTYIPAQGSGELLLISTRTWEEYIDAENPFPMVDVLPNIKQLSKLPGKYRLLESGYDLQYRLTYQFHSDGRVRTRTASNGQATETANYFYY